MKDSGKRDSAPTKAPESQPDSKGLESDTSMASCQNKSIEELIANEQRYRQLSEQSLDAIIISHKGQILDVNTCCCEMLGYTKDELCTMRVHDLHHQGERNAIDRVTMRTDPVVRFESQWKKKDGIYIDVEILSKFTERQNSVSMAVIRNITEFKFNLAKLQASEQKYRDLYERSIDAILIHQGASIKDANQRACDLLGYTKEQLCAMTLYDLHDPLEHDDIRERAMKGDGSVNFESRWKRSDGTFLNVKINSAFSDVQNNLKVAIIRDISDRKRKEQEVRDISHRKRTENELKDAREAAEQANRAKSAF